jgi:hypothetical protein
MPPLINPDIVYPHTEKYEFRSKTLTCYQN